MGKCYNNENYSGRQTEASYRGFAATTYRNNLVRPRICLVFAAQWAVHRKPESICKLALELPIGHRGDMHIDSH